MIKEVIIVEGKDDITRVKEALDCEIIATGGVHISRKRLNEIIEITRDRGAIILTDPDHAGEVIRQTLKKHLQCEIKEAYIEKKNCLLNGDVGVENADRDAIRKAISSAHPINVEYKEVFNSAFLFEHRLTGFPDSAKRRELLSSKLSLGKPNAKELLRRLNSFGIDKKRVLDILDKL